MKRNIQTAYHQKAGFTLVEMLLSLSAATILAMTMGMLLFQSTQWLSRSKQSVNLQRDMRISMDTLSRMSRSATNMAVSTGMVFSAQFKDRPPASIYRSSGDLFYDPNTTVGGDQVRLVQGSVASFTVTLATNGVNVSLAVSNSYDRMSNRVAIARRN